MRRLQRSWNALLAERPRRDILEVPDRRRDQVELSHGWWHSAAVNAPEWLPYLAAGVAIVVWRRMVLSWMRAGRFTPRAAAAVYAAIIPALVLVAFAMGDRLGVIAIVLAAIGFGLSYAFALLVFRRPELIDRGRRS